MTNFADTFAAEALPGLMDEFGEPIVYHPRAGGTRNITAIVTRKTIGQTSRYGREGELHTVPAPDMEIEVYRDSTTGIGATEFDTGGDTVEVALQVGQTPVTRKISKLIKDEGGSLIFQVG